MVDETYVVSGIKDIVTASNLVEIGSEVSEAQ